MKVVKKQGSIFDHQALPDWYLFNDSILKVYPYIKISRHWMSYMSQSHMYELCDVYSDYRDLSPRSKNKNQ